MIDSSKLKKLMPFASELTNPIADSFCITDAVFHTENAIKNIGSNNSAYGNYAEYLRVGGKATKPAYFKGLFAFYCYTLNAYVFGDLSKPDGSFWSLRSESLSSFYKWAELEPDLGFQEGELISKSVINLGEYT